MAADHMAGVPAALGLKYATLVAGFAGGVVSLSYVKELSKIQSVLAVITGSLCAGYMTPVVSHWMEVAPVLENGIAFMLGLTSMNVVPGVLKVSERFRNNPESFIKRGD